MREEIFIIDANSLITPHLNYYPFDFAPGFWEQMEQNILSGKIVILDMVKNEILQGDDALSKWMAKLSIQTILDRREPSILKYYQRILRYIQANECYKPQALAEWSRNTVADPWLIAAAKTHGYTIITFEVHNNGLSHRNPSKNAKIPDVAQEFGVKTETLFYMMRELRFFLG